ncbi:hypothetical protein N0V93_001510 [Gnomoniopsis smithogilvyi]|uniref:Acetylserotonin methytransferase-like protein n=1 Tax=Gnomoniopsis smithogilvyi TaxID=1191159 RepID=A0A9W8Z1S1_9PEZI|nr:hypothetical protein N0V93_001510 [Gnomoniopsis smithogilvyi]
MNNTPGPRPSIDSISRDLPPKAGRRTPSEAKTSTQNGSKKTVPASGPATAVAIDSAAANTSPSIATPPEPIIQRPAPAAVIDPPPRCGTAFSEAQTLVRENSTVSRNSIAKLPISPDPNQHGEAAAPIRSIFPEYNPALPLAQQNYYPTQTSPTGIPREAISRRLYSPTSDSHPTSPRNGNNPQSPPLHSPRSTNTTNTAATGTRKWPPARTNEPAHPSAPPEISSTEQLREYWKVANGWKAAASEGRVYTFKVSCERDAPVYTLASKTQQPFYRLKLDPTSTSAYVRMARFDPTKVYKPPVPPKDGAGGSSESLSMSGSKETSAKGWQEVLATTLEGSERRHAPNDGLVAMLFPSVAAKVAMDTQYTNPAANATAERECARLVWDDDSGLHFLVHPALAMPFCVTVERNPTWSRTEYTLEHIESPQHLARLTKDGTGTGWLEIDTGIASKIDSVYLADVAVAALVLVAHADGEFNRVEVFEPPPESGRSSRHERSSSRISRLSSRIGTGEKKKIGKSRLEEFEIDLESQASDLKKHSSKDKDGVPSCARIIISVLGALFKCFIWCATVAFKALTGLIGLFAKCVTSEKL